MCGIIGCFNFDVDRELFLRARDSMSRRGPDAGGAWFGPRAALGHRRLSIIDLSENGSQPMLSEDGSVMLAVNGEIYNFKGLRDSLTGKGHRFVSGSDSETLLHGYEEHGMRGLLEKIRGMFAFAVVDTAKNSLFLARDFIGIKPLYYWSAGGRFAFASELPALRMILPGAPSLDEGARDSYFTFGYVPGRLSIYKNCFKLLPGHWLEVNAAGLTVSKYWEPPKPGSDGAVTLEDCRRVIEESVEEQLVSDRPLGAFLSGGIDSSLVTAIASKKVSRLKTFTIGFDFQKYDESPFAAKIAERLGADHSSLVCSESDALALVRDLPDIYGEPYADSSAIPTFLLCRMTRESAVVAVSGDGGDELCLGYNNYRDAWKINLLSSIPFRGAAGLAGERLFHPDSFLWKLSRAMRMRSAAGGCLLSSGMFHSLFFERLTGREYDIDSSYWAGLFSRVRGVSLPSAWAWVDFQHFMVEDILTKVDRASMRNSLEVRVPLLSHKVAETLISADERLKFGGEGSKLVLKKILAGYLPPELWERPKRGFAPPLAEWLRGPLNSLMRDCLSEAALRREGLLNPGFVSKLIADHEAGRKANQSYLWNLLMWELWRERAGV
jgi:asparagine synthase (glutamine-hydrolysing)